MMKRLGGVVLGLSLTLMPLSEGKAQVGLNFERATLEQIGVYMNPDSLPADTTATIRYRLESGGAWLQGHPLLRVDRGGGSYHFAGSIFDLTPGTTYEVEVTRTPPAGPPVIETRNFTTRALPPPSGPATVTATPSDSLQAKINALAPGDVLELADGTYDVGTLTVNVAGTASQPITIRGQSRNGVVVRNLSGYVFHLWNTSYLTFENFTIAGSGVDSGTYADSIGIAWHNGAEVTVPQEYITVRNMRFEGVDQGVVSWSETHSVLVYNNRMTGNNKWDETFVGGDSPNYNNATWNDDGVRIPGTGNCAFNNTLHGFGDSFAVEQYLVSAGVYFYRNLITMTGDDAFEGDYATRNVGIYDNHVSNSATFLSLDPLYEGPLYFFRNVGVNTFRLAYKFNNDNTGHLIYNNTLIRPEGTKLWDPNGWTWGWYQSNDGAHWSWAYRNNLLLHYSPWNTPMSMNTTWHDPIDFTNNGWYPDGHFRWLNSGGSYTSLADVQANVPATTPLFSTSTRRQENDIIMPAEPFEQPIPLGASWLYEVTGTYIPVLAAGSPARNAGVAIAGINDGFSGAAPDMGAIISGRPLPNWGAPAHPAKTPVPDAPAGLRVR